MGNPRRFHRILCVAVPTALLTGVVALGAGPASAASPPGVTSKTITLGFLGDLTGIAASTFGDGYGAAQARVNMQNAEGGVNGRKLKLVKADTESSTTETLTAVQDLVENKHVFGIMADSAFTFSGSTYLTKQGVPVTGDGIDGPEWGTSSNMFDIEEPSNTTYANGKSYTYFALANFLKSIGATKVATLGYAISPSSILSTKQTVGADSKDGLKNCYENTSVPFGGVDFTAIVLQIKQLGCNALVGSLISSSNVALATAIKQAGLHVKQFYFTSYGQDSLTSKGADAALQDTYSEGTASKGNSPVVKANLKWYKELKKYDPGYHGGIPDTGQTIGWDAADTMIEGLEVAGHNPTRGSFISKLRQVKTYTIGGLFASPLLFNYLTGHFPSSTCDNFVELKAKAFVPVPANGKAVCGKIYAYKGS
jgi:branched-chain amino acid transport system substrate-binding protein